MPEKIIEEELIENNNPAEIKPELPKEEPFEKLDKSRFPEKQMLGFCSACGEQVIEIKRIGRKVKAKFLPNYYEHYIELSNKTLMRIALCDKCKEYMVSGKNPKEKAQSIVNNHITYWNNNSKKKDKPKNFKNLTATNPNLSVRDFIRSREKEKQEQDMSNIITNN
jgi:hypothetical protein